MKLIRESLLSKLNIVRDLAYSRWPSAYCAILSQQQLDYMLDKNYSLASLQKQLEEHHHTFIILFDNTVPADFVSFSEKETNSPVYHFHKIYVVPRATGTGKMLLNYIINIAKTKNATSLTLNVNRHNKARYFYEKHGFKIRDKVDIYWKRLLYE